MSSSQPSPAACAAERAEVLVAIDEEGGDVTRLDVERGSPYPGNLALGVVDDVELTERVASAIAADLRQVGVDLDLAPVADVNTNPLIRSWACARSGPTRISCHATSRLS